MRGARTHIQDLTRPPLADGRSCLYFCRVKGGSCCSGVGGCCPSQTQGSCPWVTAVSHAGCQRPAPRAFSHGAGLCGTWSQRQQAAETHQLLRGEEVELHGAQELLQLQLAQELGKAGRSCRVSHSKLQDVLNKLCWETAGCQPSCICHLQNELQMERRLFTKHILEQLEGKMPTCPCRARTKG